MKKSMLKSGDVHEFIVNRKKWLRGKGGHVSRLLEKHGEKMCCMGFYARACGIKKDKLRDIGTPADLIGVNWDTVLTYPTCDPLHTQDIARVNDSLYLDDSDRESILTKLFKKLGITVKFTG